MMDFPSFAALRATCLDLPPTDAAAAASAAARNATLTKPPGSLGRLEDLAIWLAQWQARCPPRLDRIEVLVFAGNHGVVAQGVSAFPAAVTAQMVANFAARGAAINQLAAVAGARLQVVPLDLDRPTADFTKEPAMDEDAFLRAVATGFDSVPADADLVCVGEMGIGNTTAAAAIAAALFGGGGMRWAGRGTGIDDDGLARKRAVIDLAVKRHAGILGDPLHVAAALGGRELAAILGAALAARRQRIPVLIDGFVCTAHSPGRRCVPHRNGNVCRGRRFGQAVAIWTCDLHDPSTRHGRAPSRPSTPLGAHCTQGVDARDKRGHDEVGLISARSHERTCR